MTTIKHTDIHLIDGGVASAAAADVVAFDGDEPVEAVITRDPRFLVRPRHAQAFAA